uniref:Uncharacterized protein n=1 Tax=Octopus bimaculoides TaxID=37653 RepID=A0A0L8IEM0_OCTBM
MHAFVVPEVDFWNSGGDGTFFKTKNKNSLLKLFLNTKVELPKCKKILKIHAKYHSLLIFFFHHQNQPKDTQNTSRVPNSIFLSVS